MTKLGIIGAMDLEVDALKEKMTQTHVTAKAGMEFYEGKLCNTDAVIVRCGIGKVNAALCVQILCDCFDVTHVVNTGIAGSLCADLDIGDFVISRDAIYHDMDATNFGYPMCQVPGLSVLAFPADEMLVHKGKARVFNSEEDAISAIYAGKIQKGDIVVQVNAVRVTDMSGYTLALLQCAPGDSITVTVKRLVQDEYKEIAVEVVLSEKILK